MSQTVFTNGVFWRCLASTMPAIQTLNISWNDENWLQRLASNQSYQDFGDEITYSYVGVTCQDRDERRTHLKQLQLPLYVRLVRYPRPKWRKTARSAPAIRSTGRTASHGVGRTEVNILREMYKLAKAMKTLRVSTIVQVILEIGFRLCVSGLTSTLRITWRGKRVYGGHDRVHPAPASLPSELYGEASQPRARKWVQRKDDPVKYHEECQN